MARPVHAVANCNELTSQHNGDIEVSDTYSGTDTASVNNTYVHLVVIAMRHGHMIKALRECCPICSGRSSMHIHQPTCWADLGTTDWHDLTT